MNWARDTRSGSSGDVILLAVRCLEGIEAQDEGRTRGREGRGVMGRSGGREGGREAERK